MNSKNEISADDVVKILDLKPLPREGGFYRETYRCDTEVETAFSGKDLKSKRALMTAIYYLLTKEQFGALHRLKQDEIFHYHAGGPAYMLQISPDGEVFEFIIGPDFHSGQKPQVLVPKGFWQGLRVKEGSDWSLLGTSCAPGFDFEDFELAKREDILKIYPELSQVIKRFTRL